MTPAKLCALAAAALALTACATMEPVVPYLPYDTSPNDYTGYVAGAFTRNSDVHLGIALRSLENPRNVYVIDAARDDINLINVPPGAYRIVYWASYPGDTRVAITKKEIPDGHPLAKPFTVHAGQVMLLGSWTASYQTSVSGNIRYTHTSMVPQPIKADEAIGNFRREYPAFARAPVQCLLCVP